MSKQYRDKWKNIWDESKECDGWKWDISIYHNRAYKTGVLIIRAYPPGVTIDYDLLPRSLLEGAANECIRQALPIIDGLEGTVE